MEIRKRIRIKVRMITRKMKRKTMKRKKKREEKVRMHRRLTAKHPLTKRIFQNHPRRSRSCTSNLNRKRSLNLLSTIYSSRLKLCQIICLINLDKGLTVFLRLKMRKNY